MEAAIRIDLEETPLSLSRQQQLVVPGLSKHIIRIDSSSRFIESDYTNENVYFTNTSISDAEQQLRNTEVRHDAILINASDLSADIKNLKALAQKAAVPFIAYTPKFEVAAKELALRVGVDDYHCGAVNRPFLKRLEFIRKLKEYKNERAHTNPKIDVQTEVPQIKMWSLKRTFDIIVSGLGLLFLSPILIIIAVLVKLESKGPIFYISKRAGAGYKIFNFYKFRSMRVGADVELQKLAHLNQYAEKSNGGVFFKLKNDPRVTRVGEFLRKTSLDELPQLINVLIGDMSLVGNRPLPLYEAEKLTKDQIAWRFLAPAGITGLWQVTKRGKENMSPEERIALDTEYAMKNSFWLDMKILLSTVPALLQKEKV
jgi:lipopolysaccharide/colanic/teichoic acid biosynthesis glycosyltransferase